MVLKRQGAEVSTRFLTSGKIPFVKGPALPSEKELIALSPSRISALDATERSLAIDHPTWAKCASSSVLVFTVSSSGSNCMDFDFLPGLRPGLRPGFIGFRFGLLG